MIDFHSHIIPRADHGTSSVETSLFQLRSAKQHGIDCIVATSHFYPHRENADMFLARRNKCYERLKEALTPDLPQIILGAEVLICDNIEEMPMLESLCVEGTNVLMLELPFTDFFDSYIYSVRTLIKRGYTVLLAHADRYNPVNIEKLLDVGAKIQLNVDSLTGIFTSKHLKRWISDGKVYALGSDIHGEDKKAHALFEKAVKRLGEDADFIFKSSKRLLGRL